MAIQLATTRKLAVAAATAAAMSAAGLGLGVGTAQADTPQPDPHQVIVRIIDHVNMQIGRVNDRLMNRFDRNCAFVDRRIDRHFEGSFTDRVVDHVCGTM
jgi:hypothetical protein